MMHAHRYAEIAREMAERTGDAALDGLAVNLQELSTQQSALVVELGQRLETLMQQEVIDWAEYIKITDQMYEQRSYNAS